MASLKLVFHFLTHMVFGTVLFTAIAGIALGLHLFVAWLASFGLPVYLITVLQAIEYLVFAIDIILYVWFVFREAWKLVKEIRNVT